ncbi:MAG: assimilatory sulfite reductase (NADPH) flavoprotein subunit [Saprospiraceae bacterium]|nr:assimilatory sulfite reductase (NADPH) flavoprotein subunit [Saprospiraceae bacterium]
MSNIHTPPAPVFDEELLEKLASRHSALQQMWLSGYLYALAQSGQPASVRTVLPDTAPNGTVKPGLSILYGSQTGNSKKAAQKAASQLREKGWEVAVYDLNDYPVKQLKEEQIALFVVSTQGEGEPPVSAELFHKWLMGTRAPRLEQLQFSVCALGDKSYLKFCQTGKEFDARLEALGARRIAARADCDVDFDESVEKWLENVVASLPEQVKSQNGYTVQNTLARVNGHAPAAERLPRFDRKNPYLAPLLEKIQMNGRGSAKETWHLEFSLEGAGVSYEPGDSLGVYPHNPPSLVQEVLYAAMLNGNKTVHFQGKDDLFRHILLHEVELTVLTRDLLEKYAAWTGNSRLKALLMDETALKQFLWGRNVADLLREYPAALSEATLLGFLRKMPPRLYSIASSLTAHPDEVHLTVAALRFDFGGRAHSGAASTFLVDRVLHGESVPVFIERNEYFKLPADDSTDIIMVGPGTGVAPFRAFVEERAERNAGGKNWLFFGNPHFETDFLYQTEWLNHLKRGTLDRLDVAFSRDQSDKIYVQHRLAERARLIFDRLENGASFYVCGDKSRMAADVQHAVLQLIEKESGKDADFATSYLQNLKKQRRYLEDVY